MINFACQPTVQEFEILRLLAIRSGYHLWSSFRTDKMNFFLYSDGRFFVGSSSYEDRKYRNDNILTNISVEEMLYKLLKKNSLFCIGDYGVTITENEAIVSDIRKTSISYELIKEIVERMKSS